MKLGVIGCGKMGSALLHGMLEAGTVSKENVCVSDAIAAATESAVRRFGVSAVANAALVATSEVILLCVKPDDALALLRQETFSGKLIISIVAGLTLKNLEAAAGADARLIRVMPNTPAQIGRGASAFALGTGATREDAATAQAISESVGLAVEVKEELLDAVTGLSGSGPAYVYTVIEALADGGVLKGLPRDLALKLSAQTVAGAAAMVLETGSHPASLRDMVTSPGGTTIAGLEALERAGLRSALIGAVRAATERAGELGR